MYQAPASKPAPKRLQPQARGGRRSPGCPPGCPPGTPLTAGVPAPGGAPWEAAAPSAPSEAEAESGRDAECLRIWRNAIGVLDGLYRVLLHEAGRVRGDPGMGLKPLKDLLDQTRPQTEEARQLALFVRMLADFRRGEFIAYAFKIKKACLLLLLGPRGAITALNLEGTLEARLEGDGSYGLSRLGSLDHPPPTGDLCLDHRRGGRARRGGARGPKKEGARPAMEGAQYQQLLAQLDAAPSLGAPRSESEHFPALGSRADRGAARGAPARAAYADVAGAGGVAAAAPPGGPLVPATGLPTKPPSWDDLGEPLPRGAPWGDLVTGDPAAGDLSDDPYEELEGACPGGDTSRAGDDREEKEAAVPVTSGEEDGAPGGAAAATPPGGPEVPASDDLGGGDRAAAE